MDNRAIGFFDSGVGGLTSVSVLKRVLPNEKVLFFGDTARTPYGSKSPDTIREFSRQIVSYLISKNVKMIIIACNTVTAMALDMLREEFPDVPILGVIRPTAKRVVGDGCRKVGIIGTKVTIRSGVYADTIHEMDDSIETFSCACPAFVPLIEEGIIDSEIMDLTIRHYMDDFVAESGFTDLILGCTHYPLIAPNIRKLYPGLKLYSSSEEVIMEAASLLREKDQLAGPNEFPDRFYASDLSENFLKMTETISEGCEKKIKLKKIGE
jgi:glutamate racemase